MHATISSNIEWFAYLIVTIVVVVVLFVLITSIDRINNGIDQVSI